MPECDSDSGFIEVLECYNDRWAIENTFKNTKSWLSGTSDLALPVSPETIACANAITSVSVLGNLVIFLVVTSYFLLLTSYLHSFFPGMVSPDL